jgi:hypothetical protein
MMAWFGVWAWEEGWSPGHVVGWFQSKRRSGYSRLSCYTTCHVVNPGHM